MSGDETGTGATEQVEMPGVFVDLRRAASREIPTVETALTAFVGTARRGPIGVPTEIPDVAAYTDAFGEPDDPSELGPAVAQYFANGGARAWIVRVAGGDLDSSASFERAGLPPLDGVDDVALLCLPGVHDRGVLGAALAYADRRRLFVIADPPPGGVSDALEHARGLVSAHAANGAVYFPRLHVVDPLRPGATRLCAPSGSVAGVYARTDATRGVWRPPAGPEAIVLGVEGLEVELGVDDVRRLTGAGVDAIRLMPDGGAVVWGARTILGGDETDAEWRYVSVRRLALSLERSIDRGLAWVETEANDQASWREVRAAVDRFLGGVWQLGAFAGQTADDSYVVRCGRDTMTDDDVARGRLNVLVGVAPLRPAEFVWFHVTKQVRPPG